MTSNRLQLVDRELISGTIGGVDFGYNMSCLARSPTAALLWSGGTSYTSGRRTCYGASHLYWLPRSRSDGYRRLGPSGGRLTIARIDDIKEQIATLFDDDIHLPLRSAIQQRKTLLIESGGHRFCPSHRLGEAAYRAWREEQRGS